MGIVNEQGRRRISRRRGVSDVAAERAAILDRQPARLARGLAQHRKFLLQDFVCLHLRVGRQRAERDMFVRHLYAAQFVELPDAEELSMCELCPLRTEPSNLFRPQKASRRPARPESSASASAKGSRSFATHTLEDKLS